ncbi:MULTISPECIES: FAD-dependent oxidoreductase [unclassified Roseovarius]|uniref:oxidoreductase n=1 Tax=unclassified Roseovarius TaxID=2614913 RepID=UPI00273FA524|nr:MULTISPECIES: FAD-dependent oxidoreductase [unclassified Roseovarius]
MNDPYSILFEPVKIGPVTAKNRFYQVPHCTGMGHLHPQAEATLRRIKAEGGWGVVCNQETEIHPTSDLSPFPEHRLWDDNDLPPLQLVTEAIHEAGSLAGIELAHNGYHVANQVTRAPILAPSDAVVHGLSPRQARAMDKSDIRAFRQWHRDAARRARDAGFDIVYVYAGHRMTLLHHFLLPDLNDRMDEYGGSLENRVRLLREVLEETCEAVGDTCAIAMRFAVDEMSGSDGMQAAEEGRAVVEMLAEMPDLWDVNVSDWSNDSATSRFEPNEGYQNPYIDFVKQVTTKPVVGVGRFTSPDMMASLVRKGVLDFIGAARPSIADPFLPRKIEEGRIDEIRECIGCNICVSCDNLCIPIRCTQNPTMGEEWRRGWHPEKIAPKVREDAALVVGAGPAGLECAMQLAKRGYEVTLAEGTGQLGGRAAREAGLHGLGAWKRVADHRIHDLQQRANVSIYRESALTADDIVGLGIPNVFVATGARWRRDGVGRHRRKPLPMAEGMAILTPDDIMEGHLPTCGPVVIYDDDQIYLGGVLADHLSVAGHEVTLVTPSPIVSPWTENTLEQTRIQKSLIARGVRIMANHAVTAIGASSCDVACTYSGAETSLPCAAVVLVTERQREVALFDALQRRQDADGTPFRTLELIGDAAQPGLIADAVYAGHMAARNFEGDPDEVARQIFSRELIDLADKDRPRR